MRQIADTHAHPYLNHKKDKEQIIDNFFLSTEEGSFMVVVGTNIETSREAIERYSGIDNIYFTIGIHPCDVYELDIEDALSRLEEIYNEFRDKIVAIGEIGLDYYHIYKDIHREKLSLKEKENLVNSKKQSQKDFFSTQIKLAKKLGLPIVVHNRDAKEDVFTILRQNDMRNFVMHSFSEDLEYAEKLLQYAPKCKISFSGMVTFHNAIEIRNTARNIPLDNILAETDSPFLTPTPHRGKEENEPAYTEYIVEEIARIREEDTNEVASNIFKNSREFFLSRIP